MRSPKAKPLVGAEENDMPISMPRKSTSSTRMGSIHVKDKLFNLKLKIPDYDARYRSEDSNDASTARTELSTEVDELSIREKFSLASVNFYTAEDRSSSYSSCLWDKEHVYSNGSPQSFCGDVIETTESFEIISLASQHGYHQTSTYGSSLLDLDEVDDESPRHRNASTGAYTLHPTDSQISFYGGSDGHLDVVKRQDQSRTSFTCDSRSNFNCDSTVEDPLICREKMMQPSLCFDDDDVDDDDAYEFEWLAGETKKIEDKKKGRSNSKDKVCFDSGGDMMSSFGEFVVRLGSCFMPPRP